MISTLNNKSWYAIIAFVSVFVLTVMALLLFNPDKPATFDPDIYIIPQINAFINSAVAILLLTGFYFIRFKRNMQLHRLSMLTAFGLSCLFLVLYIIYHSSAPETKFGGTGGIKTLYLLILLTHIVLASVIVPLALLTLFRIWKVDYRRHRRLGRWTLPIWLYVSITGVIVYLMISPYYPV